MKYSTKYLLAAAACTVLSSSAAFAGGTMEGASNTTAPVADDGSLESAIINGKAYIDARYRYEYVDQSNFTDEANASTLRTRLGYKTGTWNDLSATLEFEHVTEVGDPDYMETTNPTVNDADGSRVNQAFVTYTGVQDTVFQVGRQAVNLDNQRHIGSVEFRQNNQTFDSAVVINNSVEDTTLIYGYVDNINNVSGVSLDTSTNLFNVGYTGLEYGKLTAYAYLLDVDAAPALSTDTFGLRFAGKTAANDDVDVLYALEYARQGDYADNTASYDVNYWSAELGAATGGLTAKVGYENMEADNAGNAFQFALGTNHSFNGWADTFLTTPAAGLEDFYGKIGYEVEGTDSAADGINLELAYHNFQAENGGADYGDEWNVGVSKQISKNYSVAVQYADYSADTFSVDTQKLWLTFGAKF